jgi:predicted nucleic acid-binding protein
LVLNNEFRLAQIESLAPYIDNGALHVHPISVEDLMEIAALKHRHGQLSDKDCSGLHLATVLNAILITSDKQLRKAAEARGREVHGHLWVFDQMVEEKTISGPRAAAKLEELCASINIRLGLPEAECLARIRKWKKMK